MACTASAPLLLDPVTRHAGASLLVPPAPAAPAKHFIVRIAQLQPVSQHQLAERRRQWKAGGASVRGGRPAGRLDHHPGKALELLLVGSRRRLRLAALLPRRLLLIRAGTGLQHGRRQGGGRPHAPLDRH